MALEGKIRDGFLEQAESCRTMGSPFTAQLCEVLADILNDESDFGRRIAAWPEHPIKDALPLRAAGGLNYLVLTGAAPELAPLYPPNAIPSPQALTMAIEQTIARHDSFLTRFLDSPPQTNEVSRSAAILAGCLEIAEQSRLPIEIFEIGSSAGLNLLFDRYRYHFGAFDWGDSTSPVQIQCDWSGPQPPLGAMLRVEARCGCDQRPLDPSSSEDRLRLLCYVWPDQTHRVERLRASLDLASSTGLKVERQEAADWVERQFRVPKPGVVKVLIHTVVWQYLPDETRNRITAAMERCGSQASDSAGVAWLQLEYDGGGRGAGLHLRQWPGGENRLLARFDFHGRWAEGWCHEE